jgi:protein-S-isoprenylcysteine O-methyltransferase Ste14
MRLRVTDPGQGRGGSWPLAGLRILGGPILRLAGFALLLGLYRWLMATHSAPLASGLVIVGCVVLVFPAVWLGRRLLDADPTPERATRLTLIVHYLLMLLLGAAIIEAVQTGRAWPGWVLPIPVPLGLALLRITAVATLLTVVNLALSGLGAPCAVALSRRLATDWMYRWTRNPMVLATLACLLSFGLWIQSLLFVLWVVLLVAPAWLVFLKLYEERELEIRFGAPYLAYKARTSLLLPWKPRA